MRSAVIFAQLILNWYSLFIYFLNDLILVICLIVTNYMLESKKLYIFEKYSQIAEK